MRSIRPLKPEDDETHPYYYEGLVKKTAGKWQGAIGEEYEDLCQTLRMKVIEAIASFKSERSRVPLRNYVFSCIYNKIKDELKRVRHNDLYIEDVAPESYGQTDGARGEAREQWEGKHCLEEEQSAFAEILQETPLIPSTLTKPERSVLVGLYLELQHKEIADVFDMTVREVGRCVRSIKVKMADWKPSSTEAATPLEGCESPVPA